LQPWSVVGPDDLAVVHFEAGELVGGAGVVVETHDGAVRVRYVQARPSRSVIDAAVRVVRSSPAIPAGVAVIGCPPRPA
jgi:hypothetical protein